MSKIKKTGLALAILLSLSVVIPCNHQHDLNCHYDSTTHSCNHVHSEDCLNSVDVHFTGEDDRD